MSDIDDGAGFATALIPAIKSRAELSGDQVHWYAGFLGGIVGSMTAAIGHVAASTLVEAYESVAKEIAAENKLTLVPRGPDRPDDFDHAA